MFTKHYGSSLASTNQQGRDERRRRISRVGWRWLGTLSQREKGRVGFSHRERVIVFLAALDGGSQETNEVRSCTVEQSDEESIFLAVATPRSAVLLDQLLAGFNRPTTS